MGMGRVWPKVRIGKRTHFFKTCFDFMGKKTPKKRYSHSLMHSRFHLPSHFGELWDVFDHPSFIPMELSHNRTFLGFYPSHFQLFPHCACPRNPFWCYGVNGQQRITILWFVVVDLAHTMPRIVVEFKLLILGCFSPFY